MPAVAGSDDVASTTVRRGESYKPEVISWENYSTTTPMCLTLSLSARANGSDVEILDKICL